MSSNLMWKSFELHSKYFDRLWLAPLCLSQWNYKKRKYVETCPFEKLILWKWIMWGLMVPLGIFIPAFIVIRQIFAPIPLQRLQLGFALGFGAFSLVYFITMYVVSIPFSSQIALGINEIISMEIQLQKSKLYFNFFCSH